MTQGNTHFYIPAAVVARAAASACGSTAGTTYVGNYPLDELSDERQLLLLQLPLLGVQLPPGWRWLVAFRATQEQLDYCVVPVQVSRCGDGVEICR